MRISTSLIGKGIVLGLGAAAPIGPVNVEIARRVLRRGFLPGFALGCGAVSVDVTYAILSSLSLQSLSHRPALVRALAVGGTVLLFYLSFLSIRSGWRTARARTRGRDCRFPPNVQTTSHPTDGPAREVSTGKSYFTGVLLTLLNPMTLGFWFLAVPAAAGPITQEPHRDLPIICVGVFIGTLGWVIAFAGALAGAGRWRKDAWLAAADLAGGLVLFGFAVAQVWYALRLVL